jgi:hypothetical protein
MKILKMSLFENLQSKFSINMNKNIDFNIQKRIKIWSHIITRPELNNSHWLTDEDITNKKPP